MSAQLADPRQAAAAPAPLRPVPGPPRSLPTVESRRAVSPDVRPEAPTSEDVDRGIGLLLRFGGGAAVMVADVVVVGVVDRFWVLVPAFAVLLFTTGVVFVGIMRLLADGAEAHR